MKVKAFHCAAGAVDLAVQRPGREALRAFEHHVLHPVGDAGFAGGFIAAAHAVADPPADDGRAVDFFEDDGQAVGQCVAVGLGHGIVLYCGL